MKISENIRFLSGQVCDPVFIEQMAWAKGSQLIHLIDMRVLRLISDLETSDTFYNLPGKWLTVIPRSLWLATSVFHCNRKCIKMKQLRKVFIGTTSFLRVCTYLSYGIV